MKFNKVFLAGNLTRDPETRILPTGTTLTKFGIAVNEYTKKDAAEKVGFYNCVTFGRTAEVVAEFFSKGDPIFIEGRLSYRSWTTDDGQKRSTVEVVVDGFQFLDSKTSDGATDVEVAEVAEARSQDCPF